MGEINGGREAGKHTEVALWCWEREQLEKDHKISWKVVFPLQGITAWPSPLKIQAFSVAFIAGHILISFIFF